MGRTLIALAGLVASAAAIAQQPPVVVPGTELSLALPVELKREDTAQFGGNDASNPVKTTSAFSFASEDQFLWGLILTFEDPSGTIQFGPEILDLAGTMLVQGMANDMKVQPTIRVREKGAFGDHPGLRMDVSGSNDQVNLNADVFLIGDDGKGVALVIVHLPDFEASKAARKKIFDSVRYGTQGETKWKGAAKPQ